MSSETVERSSDEDFAGFFGKIPSHGDFVSRRLSSDFVGAWDRWLAECVSHSRGQLGDRWLGCYLSSPVWRFAISAGLCGESAWAGVIIPSVDKVGRYYPLTLCAKLSEEHGPLEALESLGGWYGAVEQLALSCLDDDFDLDAFDDKLSKLGHPVIDVAGLQSKAVSAQDDGGETNKCWRLGVSALEDPTTAYQRLLYHALGELFALYSLWWTDGSSLVQPSLLVSKGLPSTAGYSAFLDGAWSTWGWQDKGPQQASTPVVDEVALIISGGDIDPPDVT